MVSAGYDTLWPTAVTPLRPRSLTWLDDVILRIHRRLRPEDPPNPRSKSDQVFRAWPTGCVDAQWRAGGAANDPSGSPEPVGGGDPREVLPVPPCRSGTR